MVHFDIMYALCCLQGALIATISIAFLVWMSRLLGIYTGSWLGSWMGGTPSEMRRKVWQGMITQVSRPIHSSQQTCQDIYLQEYLDVTPQKNSVVI